MRPSLLSRRTFFALCFLYTIKLLEELFFFLINLDDTRGRPYSVNFPYLMSKAEDEEANISQQTPS